MKTVHIISLGCAKNLVDSEVMAANLLAGGYRIVPDPRSASVIVVNTCSFILPAKEESIEEILRAAAWKETGLCHRLVVTGCLPQRYSTSLAVELPEVDLFLDTNEIANISSHLDKLAEGSSQGATTVVNNPSFLMNASHGRHLLTPTHSAYLKISEGCSNFCSYCIIPALRGTMRSRPVDDILQEAGNLAAQGVRELIITAQDTTAYGRDLKGNQNLGKLLKHLAGIDRLRWIRLLYTYPGKLDAFTLATMAKEDKICSYLDIPIQHIDDDILEAMRRRGGGDQIRESIARVRAMVPGVALRTSIIVGFPGETPAKFNRLLEFVEATRFDHLGVFKYSREEETAASLLSRHVGEKTKERRMQRLMDEQAAISFAINQTLIDSRQEIVIEGRSDLRGYDYRGRCARQAPDVDGITYIKGNNLSVGDFITGIITGADTYDLYARAVEQ